VSSGPPLIWFFPIFPCCLPHHETLGRAQINLPDRRFSGLFFQRTIFPPRTLPQTLFFPLIMMQSFFLIDLTGFDSPLCGAPLPHPLFGGALSPQGRGHILFEEKCLTSLFLWPFRCAALRCGDVAPRGFLPLNVKPFFLSPLCSIIFPLLVFPCDEYSPARV